MGGPIAPLKVHGVFVTVELEQDSNSRSSTGVDVDADTDQCLLAATDCE